MPVGCTDVATGSIDIIECPDVSRSSVVDCVGSFLVMAEWLQGFKHSHHVSGFAPGARLGRKYKGTNTAM
jgi:hypothetical protein